MNNKPYHKMNKEVALSFLSYIMQAGTPSLSGMFGWQQPDNDDNITLGDLYGHFNDYGIKTVKDLLFNEIYNYAEGEYIYELRFSPDAIKNYLKGRLNGKAVTRENLDTLYNKKFSNDDLYTIENPSMPFNQLCSEDRLLYKLAIVGINMIGEDVHEYAIDVLRELAESNLNKLEIKSGYITCYEGDNENFNDYLLPELSDGDFNFETGSDSSYYTIDKWRKDNEISELAAWIEDLNDNNLLPDFHTSLDFYMCDDTYIIIAAYVKFIMDSWNDGYLTFTLSDDMPKDLYNWYKFIENSPVFPEFTEL